MQVTSERLKNPRPSRQIRGRRRVRKARRGVSDVVATILLLALTVTLFASIFVFVTSFPGPPAQNNNQFQATLVTTSNDTYVTAIRILHLAGPAVPGTAFVYLKSANHPSAPEFASPYTVSSGINGATVWNLGQTWNLTFSSGQRPPLPDDITIYIVSGSALLFSVILPGASSITPPTVLSTSVSPSPLSTGQSYTVYATLAGNYSANSVYVNLAAVPGGPSTPQPMTQNAQGQWTYTVPTGVTTNGTYYGFVNASNPLGQQTTGTVVIVASSIGSGTTNGPFSVGVILIPSPANGNTTEAVQAVVTYTGVLSPPANPNLNVTFTAISNPYVAALKWTGWAPTATISGSTSVTVASKTTWFIPSPFTHPSVAAGTSFVVYANATVSGVATVPGKLTFTPAYLNTGPTKNALIGYALTTNGSYFQPNTVVTLSIGGVAQPLTSCSTGTISASKTNVTTSSSGTFTCTFSVAAGTPALAANLLASAPTSGQNATASFTPIDWVITISPSSGLMNSTVTVGGSGFVASTTVTFSFAGSPVAFASTCSVSGTPSGSTVKVTAAGSFSGCTFPVPFTAPAGADTILATDSSGQSATQTYTVTAWNLTVSPNRVSRTSSTTSVTLTGSGFASGSKVSIVYNGSLLVNGTLSFKCANGELITGGSTITPTAAGGFSCTLTLTRDPPGVYAFTATAYASGQVAVASVNRS